MNPQTTPNLDVKNFVLQARQAVDPKGQRLYSDQQIVDYLKTKNALPSQQKPVEQPTTPSSGGVLGTLGSMAKSIVSAPATMVARPFQAAAELAGASSDAVDKFSEKYTGGLVAPVPQNAGDVKKDVGRGIETVALGAGPVTGGAAFGLGGSLEEGNDLFSAQTALRTALGAGLGKTLDVVGKPILDATGKVLGKITPELVQDFAKNGYKAIVDFAEKTKLPTDAIGKSLTDFAKSAEKIANKPLEAAKGLVSDAGGKVTGMVKGSPEEIASKSFDKTVKATAPAKGEGLTREGMMGKSANIPTARDIKVAQVAHPYIEGVKDPVKQWQSLDTAITDTATKDVTPHLNNNPAQVNFEDMRGYLETNRPMNKGFADDPVAAENYKRITEDSISTLEKSMRKTASATGNYGPEVSMNDVENARKTIDKQIEEELGKNAFGTPQYKGIKAASIDTRNLFNRMSEDILRYPGQLENLNKMNEFLAETGKRGIEIAPEERLNLEKKFGLETTPKSEANARYLSDQHDKMNALYEARDNVYEKYAKKGGVGKNKLQEFLKTPVGKVVKKAGRLIGIGEAVNLIK